MKNLEHSLKTCRSSRGFSLVEVTIAVGITALGIVAILGLIPQGLEMSRRTSEITADTHIVQQIIGEFELGDWTTLTTQAAKLGTPRNYNDQGIEVLTAGDISAVYVVKVEVPTDIPRLPSGAGGVENKYLRRILIKIATTTNPGFDFSDPRLYRSYQALIAKTN